MWINEKQMGGYTELVNCKKARTINADLIMSNPSTSDNDEVCHTSKRWFHNFKARTGIHSVSRHDEAASAD